MLYITNSLILLFIILSLLSVTVLLNIFKLKKQLNIFNNVFQTNIKYKFKWCSLNFDDLEDDDNLSRILRSKFHILFVFSYFYITYLSLNVSTFSEYALLLLFVYIIYMGFLDYIDRHTLLGIFSKMGYRNYVLEEFRNLNISELELNTISDEDFYLLISKTTI